MFLLISSKLIKKLAVSQLIELIDNETKKESDIIMKVKESKPSAIEEEKVSYASINYTNLTLSDISKTFKLHGVDSFIIAIISIKEEWQIEKVFKLDKDVLLDLSDKPLKDLVNTEDFIIIGCKEIIGLESKGVLLFNGTIYDANNSKILKEKSYPIVNSVESLYKLLIDTSTYYKEETAKKCTQILRDKILMNIEGDFAFIYMDLANKFMLFGKDRLGKKSLLLHDQAEELCITSISFEKGNYKEIIGNTLIYLDFNTCYVEKNPYNVSASRFFSNDFITSNKELLKGLEDVLTKATAKRVKEEVAVLFSGGIDSLLLAYLVHKVVPSGKE